MLAIQVPSLCTEALRARPLFVVSTRVSRRWLRHVTTALNWIDGEDGTSQVARRKPRLSKQPWACTRRASRPGFATDAASACRLQLANEVDDYGARHQNIQGGSVLG